MAFVEFQNVTIGIEAEDAKAAYAKLCDMLRDAEYGTFTYSVGETLEEQAEFGVRSATELWPNLEGR